MSRPDVHTHADGLTHAHHGDACHAHDDAAHLTGERRGATSGPVDPNYPGCALREAIAAIGGVDVRDVETGGGCRGIEVTDPRCRRRGYLLVTDGDAGYPTEGDVYTHEALISWVDRDGEDIASLTPAYVDRCDVAALPADEVTARIVAGVRLWLATPPRTGQRPDTEECGECLGAIPVDLPSEVCGWHSPACSLHPSNSVH